MLGVNLLFQTSSSGNEKHWDITTLSATPINTFVDPTRITDPRGIWFTPNGDKMFIGNEGSDYVYEYLLSTPWDLSTTTYNSSFLIGTHVATGATLGPFISNDGTRMYFTDVFDKIIHYSLSTPWDITTSVYVDRQSLPTLGASVIGHFYFKDDGTELTNTYLVGGSDYSIRTVTVSTPWDIATLGSTAIYTYDYNNGEGNLTPFCINGKNLIVPDTSSDKFFQYNLSTDWDLSTGALLGSFDPLTNLTNTRCYFEGYYLYMIQYETIYQYAPP